MATAYGDRVVTCENGDGYRLAFTEREFGPFLLVKAEGVYDAANTVYKSDNTMTDGAVYQGSVMGVRNIVLTLKDRANFPENRDMLSVLFEKSPAGKLTFTEGGRSRQVSYYVESITTTGTHTTRLTTVSLLCPDPYFYDTKDTSIYIANIIDDFEFMHEFDGEEEFSHISDERIKIIENNTAEDGVGLTITMRCSGEVLNPVMTKVETMEKLAVGDEEKPFQLLPGDLLVFTTHVGNKNVRLTRDGVTTDINEYLTYDSAFFSLGRGRNTFGYGADENPDYLSIIMTYRYKYLRA